jgi:acyl-CoA thioester hydrolase
LPCEQSFACSPLNGAIQLLIDAGIISRARDAQGDSLLMYSIEVRVRYNECDPMGFVHHSNYLTYMEMGRTEMLRASGGRYREMEAAGQFVVVVRADVRYRSPARYDDVLVVTTQVTKVTAAKIVHQYTIRRDEATLVEAEITLAVIDRNGKLQTVPDDLASV